MPYFTHEDKKMDILENVWDFVGIVLFTIAILNIVFAVATAKRKKDK